MARTTPLSAPCSCGSGQEMLPPLPSANGRLVRALGEIGADLLQLRIGTERIEAGHGHVELAAQRAHEIVAGAALGIDRRLVVLDDPGEVDIERRHLALDRRDTPFDEIGGEREARGIVLAHLAARAVAGLRVRTGGSVGALLLGLLGRDRRQAHQGTVELLEARGGGVERALHLGHRAFRRARRLRAAFEHLPVEAEAEPDRDHRQEYVAGDIEQARDVADRSEDLVEQPHDHGHQHGDREADDHFVDQRQVAHVGLDQLEHADIGRDPRQRAESDDQEQLFRVPPRAFYAQRLVMVVVLVGAATSAAPAAAGESIEKSRHGLLVRYKQATETSGRAISTSSQPSDPGRGLFCRSWVPLGADWWRQAFAY